MFAGSPRRAGLALPLTEGDRVVVRSDRSGKLVEQDRLGWRIDAALAGMVDVIQPHADHLLRRRDRREQPHVAGLERLAAEMRAREPKPPEGMDPELHRLLLARIDEIERYSMDDLARPVTMVPQ